MAALGVHEYSNPFWTPSAFSEQWDYRGTHITVYGLADMFQLYRTHCGENKDGLWQLVAFAGRIASAAYWLHADTRSAVA